MDEINSISREIIQISAAVIGFLLAIGLAIAGLEGQINALMGVPTQTYRGKLLLLTLVLGIAALAVPISKTVSSAIVH